MLITYMFSWPKSRVYIDAKDLETAKRIFTERYGKDPEDLRVELRP